MINISTLNQNDLELAYQIEKLSHIVPWSKETFFSNQGSRYINKKIMVDNQMAGFAICQTVADEATLFNIAINPNFRRQGLAKILLLDLIEQLTAKNIATLWLEVRASNLAAIGLYEKLGFNELTVRKNYYPTTDGGREDAIIMAYTMMM